MRLTSSNNLLPSGSILESSRNASSPTKQISCPSYTKREKRNLAKRHLRRKPLCSLSCSWVILTGSAKMITCTVAFPGVSRLTRGVRIFWFSLFIKSSKTDNLRKTKKQSEQGVPRHSWAVVLESPRGISDQPENSGATCLILLSQLLLRQLLNLIPKPQST